MRNSMAHQFICLMMCLCTIGAIVPGRIGLRCCIDSDCCIMSSAEPMRTWAGVRPAILRCEVAAGSPDACCDSADEACRDSERQKPCCQLCHPLVFLPTNSYGSPCSSAVQSFVTMHVDTPPCGYLQSVFRPPRS